MTELMDAMPPPRLADSLAGRRVLVLNAIRLDVPSGGATVTREVLEQARRQAAAVKVVPLGPSGQHSGRTSLLTRVVDIVKCLPGLLTIPLRRRWHWVWLEFLSRLSPFLLMNCLWQRLVWRPDVVVLNQHASFIYAWVFRGVSRVYLWHDVPSAKRGTMAGHARRHARITAAMERAVTSLRATHFTLSFDETRRLLRVYRIRAGTLPAVRRRVLPAPVSRGARLLMVGNWARPENADGARQFLTAIAQAAAFADVPTCVIAGAGADRFQQSLPEAVRTSGRLQLEIRPNFKEWSDFSGIGALVAPIHMGAGIKLKTLEAWLWDIPVLGTPQAFTGMPRAVWTVGGHVLPDIESLARFCQSSAIWQPVAAQLQGQIALQRYWSLTS